MTNPLAGLLVKGLLIGVYFSAFFFLRENVESFFMAKFLSQKQFGHLLILKWVSQASDTNANAAA